MQIQSTPLNIVHTLRPVSNCAKIVSLFEVYMWSVTEILIALEFFSIISFVLASYSW